MKTIMILSEQNYRRLLGFNKNDDENYNQQGRLG